MMLGYRFLFPDYSTLGDCYVWSRAKPPNLNREVVEFPDEIAAEFLKTSRLHTVVTNLCGVILERNPLIV